MLFKNDCFVELSIQLTSRLEALLEWYALTPFELYTKHQKSWATYCIKKHACTFHTWDKLYLMPFSKSYSEEHAIIHQ